MATEAKRACGYRKVGGLYMSSYTHEGIACCKLPIKLDICPTCNGGIKQTRAFQWIDPTPWLKGRCLKMHLPCPAQFPEAMGERVGLLWVGEQFYAKPDDFIAEANRLGISRRVKAIPRGFKLGEDWVFLAHPKVFHEETEFTFNDEDEPSEVIIKDKWVGGIFRIFKPEVFEKIVTSTMAEDAEEMDKLRERGITPVVVPDDDGDHQGSVYDKEEPEEELAL